MRVLAFVCGLVLWCAVTWSVMRSLVVPRGSSALVGIKNRAVLASFRFIASRRKSYEWRDSVMSFAAPVNIVSSLLTWLVLYFFSYGLLMFATTDLPMRVALRESGSSLFTLGYASGDRNALTILDFTAAATGPIVIGLLIGSLPTIYAAFQRREGDVTLLQARAGEPNWAPELLARHAMVDNLAGLDSLWPLWEKWAADVAETHTNFSYLVHLRSARPDRNWLVALLSVMDAAALHMSFNPSLPQGEMRVMIRQGFVCLQDIAQAQRIPVDFDPPADRPSAVTFDDFLEGCRRLQVGGYTWEREPAEAYLHFRGWRANYEDIAYELAARIDAVPAPWSGPRRPPLPVIAPRIPPNRSPERPEGNG